MPRHTAMPATKPYKAVAAFVLTFLGTLLASIQGNKDFGVTKQLELFGKNLVDLPWGDDATRAKVRVITKQWLNYEPDTTGKTDLVMAGWFPEGTFRRWRRDHDQELVEVGYEQTTYYDSGLGDSYAGMVA